MDTTPAKFVEQVRLDHAKALLDSGCGAPGSLGGGPDRDREER
ncbi:hypothetical protein [Streptomyces sp. LaBMicrA B280]